MTAAALVLGAEVAVGQAPADPLRQAETLLGRGQPAAAAELVTRSGLAESNPQASYLLGFALIQLYRFPEAEEALQRAVAARPESHAWWHALAKARLEQGRNLAAIDALDRALASGDDPRYLYARAMCRLNVGQLGPAESDLRAVVAAWPGHADALYHLGKLALDRGDHQEALVRLRAALEADPTHLEARYHRGLAELQTGRPEEAAATLEAVVEAVPGHAGALYNLGRAWIQAGRGEQGRRALERFQATSELRAEIDFLTRAVKRNPELLEGRLALSEKLLQAGRASEALEALEGARALAPDRAEIYRFIAEALDRLGRGAGAERARAFAARLEAGAG